MPNDLTAKRNLLNSRDDVRSESQRQKLTSSSFTASIWTISGVVLVACGNIEDFLGIDDGGGGGGRALHVHKSPVQGARIYFDVDGGGVSREEMDAQDARYAEGFISDAEGRVFNVPNEFYGMPFEAHLDGAFDVDTGESLSGILHSIPNADEQHLLASPITDFLATPGITPTEVMTAIEAILPTDANEPEDVTAFLTRILDPNNYLDGSDGVEALADYLDAQQSTPSDADVRSEIMDSLPTDTSALAPADTLEILNMNNELPAVTLGANGGFVGKIDAVSHAGAVQYSFVDESANSIYAINARGAISVIEGATPTATTLQIRVTNGADTEMVSVQVMVETAPTLDQLSASSPSGTVAENTPGEDLIMGITTSDATVTSWVIRAPGGLSDKFAVMPDGGNHKLVLASGQSLDFEAIPGGEFDVDVWGETTDGVRSNTLTFTITVTPANDAPVFLPAPEDNDQKLVGDGGTIETLESARGMVAQVRAHDADGDSVTYEITGGNVELRDDAGDPTGEMLFSIDGDGAITVNAPLDFDTAPTSYTLMIGVSDSLDADGNSELTFTADATATVTIDLTDANDIVPMVTPPLRVARSGLGLRMVCLSLRLLKNPPLARVIASPSPMRIRSTTSLLALVTPALNS